MVADENGGKLDNRVVFYWDEVGTIPKIESAEMMFSASRSRRVSIVPMIQSFAQLNKNYGKKGQRLSSITARIPSSVDLHQTRNPQRYCPRALEIRRSCPAPSAGERMIRVSPSR